MASWDPRQLPERLLPFFFGRPDRMGIGGFWGRRFYTDWQPYYYALYPGLLALLLAAASGLPRRRRAAWWAWGAAGLGDLPRPRALQPARRLALRPAARRGLPLSGQVLAAGGGRGGGALRHRLRAGLRARPARRLPRRHRGPHPAARRLLGRPLRPAGAGAPDQRLPHPAALLGAVRAQRAHALGGPLPDLAPRPGGDPPRLRPAARSGRSPPAPPPSSSTPARSSTSWRRSRRATPSSPTPAAGADRGGAGRAPTPSTPPSSSSSAAGRTAPASPSRTTAGSSGAPSTTSTRWPGRSGACATSSTPRPRGWTPS